MATSDAGRPSRDAGRPFPPSRNASADRHGPGGGGQGRQAQSKSIWDPQILRTAIADAIVKLHPRTIAKNPVMFVVEVGSVLTTVRLALDAMAGRPGLGFELQITFWLWLTVLFANFAEAMAEGRGKAQADTLRKARTETTANRILSGGRTE